MQIVKCPKTNEVVGFIVCLECPNFIQFLEHPYKRLECEIDWEKHLNSVFDYNETPA